MDLPRLYAIVDRGTLDARGIATIAFVQELRDSGVRLVQYRDKLNGPQKVLRACGVIAEVFAGTGASLILNDRADLAALMGWGCHVGQGDMRVEDVRKVFEFQKEAPPPSQKLQGCANSFGGLVGVSTHTAAQALEAEGNAVDYVVVGPIFGTRTKVDAESVVGLEGVRRARALTRKPLVAIGGITLENARDVVDAGADSVAVISGLFVPGRSVRDVARDFLDILR